ncbi:MAG: hypothetical protein ACOZCO_14950 [Bacteroidota bacterium]
MGEDENWVIRTWYELNLDDKENKILKYYARPNIRQNDTDTATSNYYFGPDYGRIQIIDTILRDISLQYLTIYEKDDFNNWIRDGREKNMSDSIKGKITHLRLKVDWNYEKHTGKFKAYPVGLGLCARDTKGKITEVCWLYFPEVRWSIHSNYYYLKEHAGNFYDYFVNRYWKGKIIKSVKMMDNIASYMITEEYQPYTDDQNELVALLEIELLKDEIRYAGKEKVNETVSFTDQYGGTINGTLTDGFMYGEWKRTNEKGKTILTVSFLSDIVHGDYSSWWPNGKLKERGTFYQGKKSGNWKYYNEKGILISDHNYRNGWLEGSQKTYYTSGKKHKEYNYSGFLINGVYNRFYEDGLQMHSGMIKDGYIYGEWEYNIRVNEEFQKIANQYSKHLEKITPEALKDGIISFKAMHHHVKETVLWHGFEIRSEIIGKIE